jgi:hypothetical protein
MTGFVKKAKDATRSGIDKGVPEQDRIASPA